MSVRPKEIKTREATHNDDLGTTFGSRLALCAATAPGTAATTTTTAARRTTTASTGSTTCELYSN